MKTYRVDLCPGECKKTCKVGLCPGGCRRTCKVDHGPFLIEILERGVVRDESFVCVCMCVRRRQGLLTVAVDLEFDRWRRKGFLVGKGGRHLYS
jgi:hypothetical protein